jgi:hypothetical protein
MKQSYITITWYRNINQQNERYGNEELKLV